MGHDLYRMLRASAVFPAATAGEQSVALIIADICMDTTRKPPKNMNAGARVCEDLRALPRVAWQRHHQQSWSARLIFELRVPISEDKRGRLVYAAKGHAVDYLFPVLPPRSAKGPLADGPLVAEPADNRHEAYSEAPSTDGPLAGDGPLLDGALNSKGPSVDAQRSIGGWTPTPMTPKSKEDTRAAAARLAQDQDQKPDALRLSRAVNSKTTSSRLNEQLVADDAQHFPRHDSERTTDGTGARARRTDTPAA